MQVRCLPKGLFIRDAHKLLTQKQSPLFSTKKEGVIPDNYPEQVNKGR